MATDVPVLVPRRADGGHRDMLWEFVRGLWEKEGWTVIEGHHDEGLFSRSRAINGAVERTDAEVFVVADSDVVFESWEQPREAVRLAKETGSLAYAHTTHNMLPLGATERVLAGEQPTAEMAEQSVDNTMSSCWAISRKSWERIGGFDERFVGWGAEDWMWFAACGTLLGIERAQGNSFHLWHAREGEGEHSHYRENISLGTRYMALRGNAEGMQAILSEPGGPLGASV